MSNKSSTPYCAVCFAAGKKLAEYTSHYVRDAPGGKTICPTVLNQQCNYCKKTGHTPSCCPALAGKYVKNYKQATSAAVPVPAQVQAPVPVPAPAPVPVPVKKNKNQTYMLRMATLIEEEEQAEERKEQEEQRKEQEQERKVQEQQRKEQAEAMRLKNLNENFPTIRHTSVQMTPSSKKGASWATMAAKPPVQAMPAPAPVMPLPPQDDDYFARPKDESNSWF